MTKFTPEEAHNMSSNQQHVSMSPSLTSRQHNLQKNEALFCQWSAKAPGSPHCVTTACTREDKPAGHQGWNVRHPSPCLQRKGDPPKNDCRTWASTRKPWTLPSRSPRLYGGCPPCGEPVGPTAPKPPRNLVSANAPNPPGRVSTLPKPCCSRH